MPKIPGAAVSLTIRWRPDAASAELGNGFVLRGLGVKFQTTCLSRRTREHERNDLM